MDTTKKIGIGGDHAGYEYKSEVKTWLEGLGFEVKDYGTYTEESVDYPDYVHPLAGDIENEKLAFGILICGSANGVCMTANKHKGIRAAITWNTELAELARQHNDANIICLPARFVSVDIAKQMVEAFLSTDFEGGRHERRVSKISMGH